MLASLAAQDRYGQSNYRWYILVVSVLTNTISVAIPSMALSVLFAEISADLHLNLVQVGLIWGIGALPAIFTSLIAGMISDPSPAASAVEEPEIPAKIMLTTTLI